MSSDTAKRAAARAAVALVQPEMTLGLGTGSTAAHFIDLLGEKVSHGLRVSGVPTSLATKKQALANGIDIIEPDEMTKIDLAIDGADEVDAHLNLIKGGGAALLREKIIAQAAREFVVIADASKKVNTLGEFLLPVEIDPFCWALTIQKMRETLSELGYSTPSLRLRPGPEGVLQSDGGHFIVDCQLNRIENPAILDQKLRDLPGVIETGLFVNMTTKAFIADQDGNVETLYQ